jgi:DNA-directed RNA polymerase subunit beta'
MAKNINGRYLAEDITNTDGKVEYKKGYFVTDTDARAIEESGVESVYVRSPIGCKSDRGICVHCYGADLGTMKPVAMGEAVGTVAAQAIGEPGTQLTMNIKHAGGAASAEGDVTHGLPRVEEIFERRMPRNPAVVATVSGEVIEIKDDGKEKVIIVAPDIEHKGKKDTIEYEAHVRRIPTVKVGSRIEKGQLLTDGSADLSELFKFAGKQRAQEYVMAEVIKIYELQGASISIKHVEVIIRQMFSRVKITQSGNTEYSVGDVATSSDFDAANAAAKEAGGDAAKGDPMVMGILDVSLSRASFLSAASFQNTTRMLIKASIYGALDKLEGLKENVILGRLIPAGTGFKGSIKELLVNKYAPAAGEAVDDRVRPPLARGE